MTLNEQPPNGDEFDDGSIISDDDFELEDFDFSTSKMRNPVGVERLVWDELKKSYVYPEEFEINEASDEDFSEFDEIVRRRDSDEEVVIEEPPTPPWKTLCPNCFLEISRFRPCDCGWEPE